MSKRSRKGGSRNPPAVEIRREDISDEMSCEFCHLGDTKDILQSGRLYRLVSGKSVEYYHYFCCLFSSQGIQRGKDEEGLNGFLLEDLRKEVRRGESLICCFCKKNGATIPCHKKGCKKNYHFSCGALCQEPGQHVYIFLNNMDSYCFTHRPRQSKAANLSPDSTCMICLESCGEVSGPGPGKLVSPCCGRTYHGDCVQKAALQAGKAALKCPACNDKDKFNEEMEKCGIYIPHADAQWEMPENSNFYRFDDMLHMYRRCDALLCSCPHGREFSRPGTKYEVIKCETCGQSGTHVACGKLEVGGRYLCESCEPKISSDTEDSDEEDKAVREKLQQHEQKKIALHKEKERLLNLIEDEKSKLSQSRQEEMKRINNIKSIFMSDTSEPGPSKPSLNGGKQKYKSPLAPQVFVVSNSSNSSPPRHAFHMPRRNPTPATTESQYGEEEILLFEDTSESAECKIPKIEAICGGLDAKKLQVLSVSDIIEEISDDSDSDIEIVNAPHLSILNVIKESH